MEGYNVVIVPRASSDLTEIHEYISLDSTDRATAMVDRILDSINKLKFAPHHKKIDKQDRSMKYPARSLPIGSYIVYYRVIEDEKTVRVIHIRHGSRRGPGRLD